MPPSIGNVSFWMSELGVPRPTDRLVGDAEADVAIIGAGYTGLWLAYYLARQNPGLSVRVLEARFAGFGASGRNGGWLTNTVTGGHDHYAAKNGRAAAAALQVALNETVEEVIAVTEREGIDAEIRKGGSLIVARNPAQLARADAFARDAAAWPEEGFRRLSREETDARVRVAGSLGGLWQPHCARIHPAKLVSGLADVVRGLGVRIHEDTPVERIRPGRAVTATGTVRARHVIRATEGYTATLRGERRTWVPLNSAMVITEPLPASVWAEIGWDGYDTLEDLSHVYAYAQRTPDGRIALGGRGNPYRFGSRTDADGAVSAATVAGLAGILRSWFPSTAGTPLAHGWSGVLGVPRTWRASVGYDPATGIGWGGGYVGTGVAATNLAARTLADLVAGRDTDLTRLPWVDQPARRWEIEPLRWLGIQGIYAAYRAADRRESRGGAQTSRLARVADVISGRS
ncbi:FAD-dependent oxidoreductase [Microbacterium invictum]|uniref:FAD-dependent oxidoreductase n=1 Tax=Microbacterium invictum TaxID=515415 RepID=A0ABZ0VFD9_9MICO|nr:FAD-dependent oxidoreductase [Microbacterium invictum]WQB71643.1 FAD-dependent oxidoreductase [Microbacterium invictum]